MNKGDPAVTRQWRENPPRAKDGEPRWFVTKPRNPDEEMVRLKMLEESQRITDRTLAAWHRDNPYDVGF